MPLIDPSDILSNLLVLGILAWIAFLVYSKMNKSQVHSISEKIRGLLGGKNAR